MGRLQIDRNPILDNLDGLSSLTSVVGDLIIGNNAALTNLNGLSSLTSVGGVVQISRNTALTSCAGVAPVLGWPVFPYKDGSDGVSGTVTINDNDVGAQNPDDCLAAYVPPPATPVPVMPNLVLAILAGLLGLFATRRLRKV